MKKDDFDEEIMEPQPKWWAYPLVPIFYLPVLIWLWWNDRQMLKRLRKSEKFAHLTQLPCSESFSVAKFILHYF